MRVKLIHCNGKLLRCFDMSDEPILTLRAGEVPIKFNGYHIMEDDDAREALKDLIRSGLHTKE